MTRYRATAEGNVPYTAEEEAEADKIEAALLAQLAEEQRNAYRAQRAAEYPPIGDQLDALWKGGEAAAAMLAQVQAVKTKYPKP